MTQYYHQLTGNMAKTSLRLAPFAAAVDG